MTFGKAILSGYRNTFNFTGKASVDEYWWFVAWELTVAIAAGAGSIISGLILIMGGPSWTLNLFTPALYIFAGIPGFVAAVTIFPVLTAQIRRVRDAGRSGLWVGVWLAMLVAAVPLASKNLIQAATLCVVVHGVLSLFIFVWTLLPSRVANAS